MNKIYYTYSNGGFFYKVIINKEKEQFQVLIRKNVFLSWDEPNNIKTIIKPKKYLKLFIGNDPKYPKYKGNSILIQLTKTKYIFISDIIYIFTTKDEIYKYKSPIGNSMTPYPYAIGYNNIYLLTYMNYIPIADYDKKIDPYELFHKNEKNYEKNKFSKYKLIHNGHYPIL